MKKLVCGCAYLLCLLVLSPRSEGLAQDDKIVVGENSKIHSDVLKEDRNLMVYLPGGYAQGREKYPVIYLLDGAAQFLHTAGTVDLMAGLGMIPPMIIVGIPNTDRTRDLSPPTTTDSTHQFPTSGGADAFLKFLTDELVPFVNARYRTLPYRILIGHSLGGLFAVHAMLHRPDSFDAYLAESPSLWWSNESELASASSFFRGHRVFRKFLYLTLGSEGDHMLNPIEGLTRIIDSCRPQSFTWKFVRLPAESHGTTPFRSTFDGLALLFSRYVYPFALADSGVAKLEKHFAALSGDFGFEIKPPESVVNTMGYILLGEKKVADAIAMFQFNVAKYPQSANVYDSLADGYEQDNQLKLAAENCGRACDLGTQNRDPNLFLYEQHRDKVLKMIQGD